MECLLLLRDKVGRERRPLSWLFGPQDTQPLIMPSMRDLKRDARARQADYPSIDRLPLTDPLWRRPGERRPGERTPSAWTSLDD
jgi:NADH-quinone oxidoreductase subunit B